MQSPRNILRGYVVVFVLLSFPWFHLARSQDQQLEKLEVEKVISISIGWALQKDLDLLYSSVAHDSSFFIFHPDSATTITGFENFRKLSSFWMDPKFKATDFNIKDLRINLSRYGDVAWYSCYLDDHALWDGKKIGWDNARWTGVLEKREGRWLIVQMHFSLASR